MADVLTPSYAELDDDGADTMGRRVVDLVQAAVAGDRARVAELGAAFAREYRGVDRKQVQSRIHSALQQRSAPVEHARSFERLPVDNKSRLPLIEENAWPSIPLVLGENVGSLLNRFVLEVQQADKLRAAGISSRMNLLLSGPPGTGKTFIAGHVAARLGRPFHVLRLDSVVSSLLGDTARNLRAALEFARVGSGFLFLDEIDAVAKARDDRRELGEIKRVVNTLIQSLDFLDERVVIIAATNHAQLLDEAIFRRFPYMLEVPLPDLDMRKALWSLYLYGDAEAEQATPLAVISDGLTCSDIKELSLSARRTSILDDEPIRMPNLTLAILESRAGQLKMPTTGKLLPAIERTLNERLRAQGSLTFAQIGGLMGVSKQAAVARAKRAKRKPSKRLTKRS